MFSLYHVKPKKKKVHIKLYIQLYGERNFWYCFFINIKHIKQYHGIFYTDEMVCKSLSSCIYTLVSLTTQKSSSGATCSRIDIWEHSCTLRNVGSANHILIAKRGAVSHYCHVISKLFLKVNKPRFIPSSRSYSLNSRLENLRTSIRKILRSKYKLPAQDLNIFSPFIWQCHTSWLSPAATYGHFNAQLSN